MHDLSSYKCAIFDCDGVILQSNELKSIAFAEALRGDPINLINKFVAYHKSNGGVSRYVKFEHYYREFKQEENAHEMIKMAISRYAQIVVDQLKTVDYVPGVLSAIEFFNGRNIPCFVVSGGDQEELYEVFKYRGIFHNFVKILGSPVTKDQHISALLLGHQIDRPAIFFGDARSDMNAALSNEIDFCFVRQFSEWSDGDLMAERFACRIIDNFNDIIWSDLC